MWRDEAYLLDILLAARRALRFNVKATWEDFERDELRQHATARTLEIIGEAARKISPEFKAAHPEIPWADMIGLRHRLIHEYFRIDLRRVWDTVQNDLPKLIALVEPLVPGQGEPENGDRDSDE
jgi:uncharacterized protein with HEPN domain